MIDILFEQRIIQNPVLAAECLWHSVHEAHEAFGRADGVSFPLIFIVLPLVFHKQTAKCLAGKTQPGALYKALADDREIPIGLQSRMQSMADRTLQGLSLAFDSMLIYADSNPDKHLIPGRKTPPVIHMSEEVKTILNAAKRVGQAFSEMSPVQLSTHLKIQF